MSDLKNPQPSTPTVPSHTAYHVREREGAEMFWTRIGCAWAHRDGKGFNLQLECTPIDGRITLRTTASAENN